MWDLLKSKRGDLNLRNNFLVIISVLIAMLFMTITTLNVKAVQELKDSINERDLEVEFLMETFCKEFGEMCE